MICKHDLPVSAKFRACFLEAMANEAEIATKGHKPKSRKEKKCKACKQKFIPTRDMQRVCSGHCGLQLASLEREKRERRETRTRREAIKTLPELLKRAQIDFNRYINVRDADKPCIACGEPVRTVAHASHYLSVGARPNLRFSELNVHRGCSKCNVFLHGNLINFRINLIARIGLEAVEALEADHEPKNYTREQVADIGAHYRKLTRELKK